VKLPNVATLTNGGHAFMVEKEMGVGCIEDTRRSGTLRSPRTSFARLRTLQHSLWAAQALAQRSDRQDYRRLAGNRWWIWVAASVACPNATLN
jgi:hypothetical protein